MTEPVNAALSEADLATLLARTSRTFALAIPLLGPPLARDVGLAYLLFRLADTLEDAPAWGRAQRERTLGSFADWLDGVDRAWLVAVATDAPTDDAGCLELVARADDVRASLDPIVSGVILGHTKRTALGMRDFVARQDEAGRIVLADVADLRRYAYVVAGLVGELLTELFVLREGLARAELDMHAALFGEGLQLVNILKDAPADAREGRSYLPADVPRADVFTLARADLAAGELYVRALERAGASRGTVAFCELPLRLAEATLDRLEDGAPKLSRDEVMRIAARITSR